jgi:hypothetical protein
MDYLAPGHLSRDLLVAVGVDLLAPRMKAPVGLKEWRYAAIIAVLAAICLAAALLISAGGAAPFDWIASGAIPYVFGLAALVLLVVNVAGGRGRGMFRDPRTFVFLAVGIAGVVAIAIAVNLISPYQDCGPGGNLVSIGSGHGFESRDGIQLISDQQYRSYLACGGVRSWLQAFAAAGVALVAQISALVARS